MSVQGVSASTNPYLSNLQSSSSTLGSAFQSLAAALQSGDLKSAQNAFSQIQSLMQNSQSSQGTTTQQANGQQNQFSTDFAALGKALQSGDVSGAQTALKKLQQDMQSSSSTTKTHHHHHHHHGGEAPSQATASSSAVNSTAGSTDSTGTNINTLL